MVSENPQNCFKRHSESASRFLSDSGNDQALVDCCAVDHKLFKGLLELFQPVFDSHAIDWETGLIKKLKQSRVRRVHPRKVSATGVLGLVLFWCQMQGSSARAISLTFGLAASNMHGWLQFGQGGLLHSLQCHPAARVMTRTGTDVNECVHAVAAKCLLLGEEQAWAAADGSKLPLQQSSHWLKQNVSFNGQLSHTCVNSVFVFGSEGLIRCATINCPGSWHDSTQADCGVCSELKFIHALCGLGVVVDSAFGLQAKDFLIKSGQEDPIF